jgi:hypothetical protein
MAEYIKRSGDTPIEANISEYTLEPDWMSVRDQFAMAAMQGILVSCRNFKTKYNLEGLSIEAYQVADAMLKERDGHTNP